MSHDGHEAGQLFNRVFFFSAATLFELGWQLLNGANFQHLELEMHTQLPVERIRA